PLPLIVREPPDQTSPTPPTSTNLHQPSVRSILHRPAFYLLLVGSMCSIAAVGGTNQHLKLFLSLDHGFTQAAAAGGASLVLAASLVGRLGMGCRADRYPKKYVMLLIYGLVASGIPLLFLVGKPGAIYLFAVIFGIGLGGEYMVIPLMAAELFGVRVLGRAMGVVLTADGVAEAVAPVLVGRMHDVSGSYATGFVAVIAFALAGAVAISFLPRASPPVPPSLSGEGSVGCMAAAHGLTRVSAALDACLANPADEIYFDATVTSLRVGHVRRAIAAGKHVYCEKPVAATTAEALELASAASRRGVKHGVVQDKLFLPGIRKLKRLVDDGLFGRILSVRGEFGYWVFEGDDEGAPAQRPSWNYRHEDGGGLILDMFAHWRYLLDHT